MDELDDKSHGDTPCNYNVTIISTYIYNTLDMNHSLI